MNPPTPTVEFDLGPIIYFYTHSLLIIAFSALVFMGLGIWIGWLTWARFKRRARAFQEECDLLRHEIAALKRRIGEATVGPALLVLINEDAPVPASVDHGPALPGFEALGGLAEPPAAAAPAVVAKVVSPGAKPAGADVPSAESHKESLAAVVLGTKGAAHHTHEPAAPPDSIAELSPAPASAALKQNQAAIEDPSSSPAALQPVSTPESPPATNGAHPPGPSTPVAAERDVPAKPDPVPAINGNQPPETITPPPFAAELASGVAIADPLLGILLHSQPERWDDLTLLRGVGEVLQQRLHDCGVHTFKQIAYWTEGNVEAFSTKIDAKDRIRRERWVNQARDMHFLKYGEKLP